LFILTNSFNNIRNTVYKRKKKSNLVKMEKKEELLPKRETIEGEVLPVGLKCPGVAQTIAHWLACFKQD
jgi:hypothetical protein